MKVKNDTPDTDTLVWIGDTIGPTSMYVVQSIWKKNTTRLTLYALQCVLQEPATVRADTWGDMLT